MNGRGGCENSGGGDRGVEGIREEAEDVVDDEETDERGAD